jgi:hypothetical protein
MEVVCPNCGSGGQFAGKYCENCGYLIPADAASVVPAADPAPAVTTPVDPLVVPAASASQPVPASATAAQPGAQQRVGSTSTIGAQFAIVRDGQASLNEGFTITRESEFLVGRMDPETGHQVDVDLRQWVQPIEVGGQKQYLIHRKQCYIGLAAGGVATIRSCSGSEGDTLVRAAGETTFTSLQNLGEKRPQRSDGSFELQLGDQIYMGDPDAVMYYVSGDPTAQGNYIVVELINKS